MNKLNKLYGFRTNKLWKKIIAIIFYLICVNYFFDGIKMIPKIKADLYDMIIFKISNFIKGLSMFLPILCISDFAIKEKIPLIKRKKWWTDIIGYFTIFILINLCSDFVYIFHTNDYQKKYDAYNTSKIIYKEENKEEVKNENTNNDVEKNEYEENISNEKQDDNNQEVNKQEENKEINDYNNQSNNIITNTNQVNLLKIHYIDVGQGDSIFVELPNKKNMLIDAGESYKAQVVANYIYNLGYYGIDYIVGTHPHTDHIGGLASIINKFNIGSIYMPKALTTTKTYENLLNTIIGKGLSIKTAKAGVNILNDYNLSINILAPNKDYSNLNNASAVIKIVYGNKKFLFMGDAEAMSENDISLDVSADVIKIGHHGSDTSSSQSFINRVRPQYGIISVGYGNQYNHPSQNIIDRFQNFGTKIYRTDVNGNIVITTDGNTISINTTR